MIFTKWNKATTNSWYFARIKRAALKRLYVFANMHKLAFEPESDSGITNMKMKQSQTYSVLLKV